jgi:hypothetical protein
MPRSAAGKAAREQKLSAASAWKRGHTGGRGRGKFRAQGRGGRGGRGGLGGRRDEWHGADARAAAASRDDGVHPETPTAPYEDDEDDDPVKAVRAGDAYQALLASLAGSGDDPADDEFADALAANDEASDSETASASDESRGDGDVEVSEGDGDEDRSSMEEEEDGDEPPDERGGDGDAKKASFRDDDEADAREGDEEDLVAETSSDEDDSPEDDSDDTNGTNDGSRRKRTGASETKDDCAKQKATDPLDAHLARRVDATVAERIKTLAPKFRPPSDVLSPTRITSAFTAKKTKATEKKEHTGSNESKEKETHVRAGRWEFDQAARGDARSELAEAPRDKKHRDEAAGRTFAVDAFASAFGDGSDKSTGFAPTDLPAKVKERWNATRDPEAHEARLKKQRRVLESVAAKAKKSGALDAKASVEAAKASAASELSSTPPAPYASRRQAEFHELLKTYADVTFPDRAPLGLTKSGAGDEMMDAYLLHAVAHVTRTRRRITKNNEALLRRAKAEEAARDAKKRAEREARSEREATATAAAAANADASASARTKSVAPKKNRVMVQDDVPRDQGFARATVLILVPMRNVAGKVVRRLLELCPAAHGRPDAVSKLERLADDFGFDSDGEAAETEKRRKKNLWVPEDHSAMFSGNTDDHFRLGIKVTKASVRLYVDFFGSDILVASPLGTCFGHSFQSAKRAFWRVLVFFFTLRVFSVLRAPFSAFFAGDETFTAESVLPAGCGRTSCSLLARGDRTRKARRPDRQKTRGALKAPLSLFRRATDFGGATSLSVRRVAHLRFRTEHRVSPHRPRHEAQGGRPWGGGLPRLHRVARDRPRGRDRDAELATPADGSGGAE